MLASLHPILQILGKVSPAHHPQLARWIIGPQSFHLHQHFSHRCLVVLGVANLGGLQHVDLE